MDVTKTILLWAMVAGIAGCCNYCTRTEGEIAPYACAPHPYYCTATIWPDVALTRKYHCGTAAAFARIAWPFSVVDEVGEVAFDTVFLPVDLMCLFTKKDSGGNWTPAEPARENDMRRDRVHGRVEIVPVFASPVIEVIGNSNDAAVQTEATSASGVECKP